MTDLETGRDVVLSPKLSATIIDIVKGNAHVSNKEAVSQAVYLDESKEVRKGEAGQAGKAQA
jgi:hypothetical protein